MEPTVGGVHRADESGAQSCEFTLRGYADFEIFLGACWIQVLPVAVSGLPSPAGSVFLLKLGAHSQGPLLLSPPGFFPGPLFLRKKRI